MNQNIKSLQITKQLHHIYPDIEGELCSRHSTLFGKLKTTFNKLYDNMEPNHYVIVKGNCQFIEQQLAQIKLSMALENGVIILVSKTYPTSQIYVNGNHFGEQVIFTHNGKLSEGLNPLSTQIQSIIKDATQNLPQNQRFGGIMYIHTNIPEDSFRQKQTFFMSFYLAILSINDNLINFTEEQLIKKMTNLLFMGSRQQIQRQFLGYKNRKLNLTLPDLLSAKDRSLSQIPSVDNSMIEQQKKSPQSGQSFKQQSLQSLIQKPSQRLIQKSQLLLDMNKQFRFLFCKLDLSKEDVNYEFRRRKQLQIRKKQLLNELNDLSGIKNLFQLFHKINLVNIKQVKFTSKFQRSTQPLSMQDLQCQDQRQILNTPNEFIQVLLHEIGLVSEFSNQNINLEQLINSIWEINSTYLKIHSDDVVELVEEMKQRLQIKGCMVVNQDFLMIVVPNNRFTELLCEVKHKMKRGQLKSKSLFRIEDEQLVLHRWSSDKAIGQKMFTSVPSEGVGIFDPSEAIWFD